MRPVFQWLEEVRKGFKMTPGSDLGTLKISANPLFMQNHPGQQDQVLFQAKPRI